MVGIELRKEGILILGCFIYFIYFIIKLIINRKKLSLIFLKEQFNKFILVIYLLFVVGITLCPFRIPFEWSSLMPISPVININPLNILSYGFSYYSLINIIGNLILLVPLPILLVLNGYKRIEKLKYLVLICLLITLSVEFCQYWQAKVGLVYIPRTTDILDVIFNTLGGVIGYYSFKIYKKKIK